MAVWEVDLQVEGPVTVHYGIEFSKQKGFREDDPFYSEVSIRSAPVGLDVTITARASSQELSAKAALFFFGRMLDALTLELKVPMRLVRSSEISGHRDRHYNRCRIERESFERAFDEALELALKNPVFLRSLGWFRKGLNTVDPFDQFLAFWNSIEIVASKYFGTVCEGDALERAKKGVVNQVWACFLAVWGENAKWPLIERNERWINEAYDLRKLVAHGLGSVDVPSIEQLAARIPILREVAHRFLVDWRASGHFKPEQKPKGDEQPYLV